MLLLMVISLIVTAALICIVFYNQLSTTVQSEVRERANMLKAAVTEGDYASLAISDMRLTIISAEGIVLYDDDEDASLLPNHLDREEVQEALASGTGESKRFSDTLGQETYYCAVQLGDGSILRVAKTMDSIWGMFGGALPVVIGVVLIISIVSYLLAGKLTRRIVEPINRVDLKEKLSAPYDELAPFVKTIAEQQNEIARQMNSLQERADTIEALMDSMSEGIVIVNHQGTVLSINKSAAAFFSLPLQSAGKSFQELFRDIELIDNLRSALSGNRSELSYEQDGKIYRAYFSPVSGIGAIILFMDITAKANAEALRREFSANVSHELKTPLTTIFGNAEMLERGMVKDSDQQAFYQKIKTEAGRMIALIEDIILISRLDEDGGKELFEEVEILSVAAETIEALSPRAEERDVSLILSGDPVSLNANRSQIYELFYNLIDNAIKYNKEGGEVKVDIASSADEIILSVSDCGIGIPKEAQDHVFERFYRVDKSRSKQTGGTGLGLAIVKHIVMAHGGRISLDSRVGQGTTITVSIPIN